ncbi:hypothetical protein CYMTET_25219 [Cymbomonas tetramitiformis]|uniref:Translation initiation factor IF-3 n=1 Tax=Cymbomonas tetramitiformis TaxID=36881 RepID=A0AAE0FUH5_9CHLO|nr:hypothetical protein CYMTET_25219 [Cymbomonas tetramitiformis]
MARRSVFALAAVSRCIKPLPTISLVSKLPYGLASGECLETLRSPSTKLNFRTFASDSAVPEPTEVRLKSNDEITASQVRIVRPEGGHEVLSLAKALREAENLELDLVEVDPNADPPVCRLMDYAKARYDKRRRRQGKKAASKRSQVVKEVRLGVRISEHDLTTKLNTVKKFLEKGMRVKVVVTGKMSANGMEGQLLLEGSTALLADHAKMEKEAIVEGSGRVTITYSPIVKKTK